MRVLWSLALVLASIMPCLAQPAGYDFIRHHGKLVRLPIESLPWRVYVTDQRHFDAFLHAVRTWNEAGHRLGYPDLFAPVAYRKDADMILDWSGKGLPPDKAGGVFWNFGSGEARISKLVMDPFHKIPEGNRAQILLQELGHCLGLGDSTATGDVMHTFMHTKRYRRVTSAKLTPRDLEAFRWLYSQTNFVPIVSSARAAVAVSKAPIGPASGRLQFAPVKVELTRSVNVRITLHNPTEETLAAPLVMELYGRVRGDSEWRLLKSWNGIPKIAKGYRLSRDFFSGMQPMFQGDFELLCKAYRRDTSEVLAERRYP